MASIPHVACCAWTDPWSCCNGNGGLRSRDVLDPPLAPHPIRSERPVPPAPLAGEVVPSCTHPASTDMSVDLPEPCLPRTPTTVKSVLSLSRPRSSSTRSSSCGVSSLAGCHQRGAAAVSLLAPAAESALRITRTPADIVRPEGSLPLRSGRAPPQPGRGDQEGCRLL
eukprot:scaffold106034_cov30-Tisochrysis_lutea.AAC.1